MDDPPQHVMAASMLLDAVSLSCDGGTDADALRLALGQLRELLGADPADGSVDVTPMIVGALTALDHLVHEVAQCRGVDPLVVVADAREAVAPLADGDGGDA
jgi:hypothetical protein